MGSSTCIQGAQLFSFRVGGVFLKKFHRSQCVFIRFPSSSHFFPHHLHNINTYFLSHMFWQMLSSFHLYKLAKKEEHHPFWYLGDCCKCIVLVIIKFLFHITPTLEWNGNFLFKDCLDFWILERFFFFLVLNQLVNLLHNKIVFWASPPRTN